MSSVSMQEALLGAILDAEGPEMRSNAAALIDRAGMRPEDLSDQRVSNAWGICQRLVARRRPVDARLVHAAGLAAKLFGEDDLGWLLALQSRNALNPSSFADLSETVRSMSRAKQLAQVLAKAQSQLLEPNANLGAIASLIEGSMRDALALNSPDSDGAQDVIELANDWEAVEGPQNVTPLVPTCIGPLDEVITGFVPNLNVIFGLPSTGKSALVGSIIDAQLEAGFRVGLFGLEDGTKWGPKRVIARDMGMPVRDVAVIRRTREQSELSGDVMAATAARWKNCVTFTQDSISIDELCRRATQWILERGVQIIFIDHIGEVDHFNPRFSEFNQMVAESWRRLRNLAIRYNVPIVVLAHARRPADDNEERPPRMTEIAESAYAERKARIILGVWRRFRDRDFLRVTVAKHTEGESNVHLKLQRHVTAALVSKTAGERVDLEAERQAERNAANEKKKAEKALEKEREKAKEKKPQPQLTFVRPEGGDNE